VEGSESASVAEPIPGETIAETPSSVETDTTAPAAEPIDPNRSGEELPPANDK
jgi:hypothetical protein